MRICLWCCTSVTCLALFGCGGGGNVIVKEQPLGEFLGEFQVALIDATGTLESVQAALTQPKQRMQGEEEEEDSPEDQIRNALQMVSSSAEQLAQSAAGHAAESEAKAIASAAQELLKKSQGSSNAAVALQGVKQLAAKAEAIKAKL